MNGRWPGERLFSAWGAATSPFDVEAGRGRFLETFAVSRGRSGRLRIALAVGAMVACGIGLVCWRALSGLSFTTATGEGQAGAWLATGKGNELPLTFSEGTRVVMAPDSRGRVEQLGRAGASFLLER